MWECSSPSEEITHFQEGSLRKPLEGRSQHQCLALIVAPKFYQKLTLDSNGTLKKECFTVRGRKIPLVEIRKNLLAEHEGNGSGERPLRGSL